MRRLGGFTAFVLACVAAPAAAQVAVDPWLYPKGDIWGTRTEAKELGKQLRSDSADIVESTDLDATIPHKPTGSLAQEDLADDPDGLTTQGQSAAISSDPYQVVTRSSRATVDPSSLELPKTIEDDPQAFLDGTLAESVNGGCTPLPAASSEEFYTATCHVGLRPSTESITCSVQRVVTNTPTTETASCPVTRVVTTNPTTETRTCQINQVVTNNPTTESRTCRVNRVTTTTPTVETRTCNPTLVVTPVETSVDKMCYSFMGRLEGQTMAFCPDLQAEAGCTYKGSNGLGPCALPGQNGSCNGYATLHTYTCKSVTASASWDNSSCNSATQGMTCSQTSEVCTDSSPQTRTVNGVTYTSSCWGRTRTYQCTGSTQSDSWDDSQCGSVIAGGNCAMVGEVCGDAACSFRTRTYQCQGSTQSVSWDHSACTSMQSAACALVSEVCSNADCTSKTRTYQCQSTNQTVSWDDSQCMPVIQGRTCSLHSEVCANADCSLRTRTYQCQGTTETITWDASQCTEATRDRSCTEGEEVCADAACTSRTRTYTCDTTVQQSDCSEIGGSCIFQKEYCIDEAPEGACKDTVREYRCSTTGAGADQPAEYTCGNDVYCINGECETIEREASTEFKDAVVGLNVLGQANAEFNETTLSLFKGTRETCHKKIFGAVNCCAGKGFGPLTAGMFCDKEERALDTKDKAGLCHYLGSYCSDSVLGVCVTSKKAYCCFASKLTRILQEQGRPQIGKTWGKPKEEKCLGFTIEEFSRLDLSVMDFSEVYKEFTDAARLPDEIQTTQQIQTRIQEYYDSRAAN